jgi:hypothetical protein
MGEDLSQVGHRALVDGIHSAPARGPIQIFIARKFPQSTKQRFGFPPGQQHLVGIADPQRIDFQQWQLMLLFTNWHQRDAVLCIHRMSAAQSTFNNRTGMAAWRAWNANQRA